MMFLAAVLEKSPVHFMVPLEPENRAEFTKYHLEMNRLATEYSFEHCGEYKHAKGGRYKLYFTLWISPDKQTMGIIVGGRLARVQMRHTRLISFLDTGNIILTTDEVGYFDISGTSESEVVYKADFGELLAHHEQCLQSRLGQVISLNPDQLLQQYQDYELYKVERILALGYGAYTDVDQREWRHTVYGGFRPALQLFTSDKRARSLNAKRVKIRRPGEKGYIESHLRELSPAERELEPSLQPVLHSRKGIASFILGVVAAILFTVGFGAVLIGVLDASQSGELIFCSSIGAVIGLVLSISGWMERDRKKKYAIWGLVINGLVVLFQAGLILFVHLFRSA